MIAAVSIVRDEADIIEATISNMLQQVDRVYVADNGSTDGTRDLLDSFDIVVLDDAEFAHDHGRKITELAERAHRDGADWVVPFDADELWLARGSHRIADALETLDPEIAVCEADLYDRVSTSRDDLSLPPVQRMRWRRPTQLPLPKIAFRATEGAVVQMGNHGVTLPANNVPLRLGGLLLVHHFPYRSPAQFIHKVRNGAAAMRATKMSDDVCAHWRQYDRFSDDELREVYLLHFFRTDPTKPLDIDGELHPPLVHDPVQVWAAQLS